MMETWSDITGFSLSVATSDAWTGIALLGAAGFVLGFALNHGSICTVIATKELIAEKRPARFIALAEAAVWAALIYALLATPPRMEQGWLPLAYLVPAAVLFGVGTYVNSACVFGSVGHFGNGEIDFGFVFFGIGAVFYIEYLLDILPAQPAISASLPAGTGLLAIVLVAIIVFRLTVSRRSQSSAWRLTLSIAALGITYTVLAIVAPGFSITASVGSLITVPVAISVISICMIAGTVISSRVLMGRFMVKWPTIQAIVRRALGGALMGLGALLIPGGNDTLLMIGLPMGAWQALLAYALFVATLAILIAKFGSSTRSWS
jgi:uncharacterized protein